MDNSLKILGYLGRNLHKSFTMHELSLKLNIPYASFYRTVKKMHDLLSIEQIGKSKALKLNLDDKIIQAHLALASDEHRKEFLKNQPIIKKIGAELDTEDVVLLFGSYAKREETENSDIDLLIINKDGNRTINLSKYEMLFKKNINPIFIQRKEFTAMLKSKEENIGKQALKNHFILNNPLKFWELVINAIR